MCLSVCRLGRYKSDGNRGVFVDVPDRVDSLRKWLGPHENARRRRLEIQAQGGAKPAFHLFSGNNALVPIPEDLRGAPIFSWKNLRIATPQPCQLGVGSVEWLRTELERSE